MVARLVATSARAASTLRHARTLATVSSSSTIPPVSSTSSRHKVVVVGGGAGGLSASHQLLRSGKYTQDDIAVIDPAAFHHYQPGWTLVGGGLKNKEDLRMPLPELLDPKLKLYSNAVETFAPEQNEVTLADGSKVSYEQLIVAPGIQLKYDAIKGLPEALADPSSKISTIYGYDTCDKTFRIIEQFSKGKAIFTQPAGIIKCAGAPQKALWLALDLWKKAGRYNPTNPKSSDIQISFATGLPVMFGVKKYSEKLNQLREERGVEGLFQHDLVEINGDEAVFALADGSKRTKKFDLLHAVPKMGAYAFVAKSPLADAAGMVEVNKATLQHTKFANVWSLGDASSLPTSKTVAAITAQTPVLVENLLSVSEGKQATAEYDGYASCPLTTEYGKVLLAEFKYDLIPKETFGKLLGIDQSIPRRSFYHLKKDFFPWVYKNHMVKGTWGGPKGFRR